MNFNEFSFELYRSLINTAPIAFFVTITIAYVLRTIMGLMERTRYDAAEQRAVLSEMRASYEHRIADLSRQMVATQSRWEDANHLLISGQRIQAENIGNSAIDAAHFLQSFGIDPKNLSVHGKRIFYLTPFAEEERPTFDAVKEVCHSAGFEVVRGDEERAEGDILQQVVKGIVASRIVIANISSRNANVFFELGIAIALGKPTLLLSDTLDDVPFDVRARRIIMFHGTEDLQSKLRDALLQTIGGMIRNAP